VRVTGTRTAPSELHAYEEMTMMFWYGSGMGGWGYAVVTIGMAVFWGAVIYGIVALIRHANRDIAPSGEPALPPAPERLLAERFARGEIDGEEYERRLAGLRAAGRAGSGQARTSAETVAR
jgi:putative membrane protein